MFPFWSALDLVRLLFRDHRKQDHQALLQGCLSLQAIDTFALHRVAKSEHCAARPGLSPLAIQLDHRDGWAVVDPSEKAFASKRVASRHLESAAGYGSEKETIRVHPAGARWAFQPPLQTSEDRARCSARFPL